MKKIMIIEDSKLHQKKIKDIISDLGYEISGVFAYGEKAIDYILKENNQPDLIIIDIILAGKMNGYQAAKKISSETNIPFIFLTVKKDKIEDFEASVYLNKPFSKQELKNNIELVLYKYDIYKKMQEKNEEQEMILDTIDTQIWYLKDPKTYGKVNQARADFMGVDKSDIENKKLTEFLDAKEAKNCDLGNRKVFKEKKKIQTEEWLENSQGEKRLIAITKNPKLNKDGEVEYVVCSGEDVTEKYRKQKVLQESKNRYQQLFKNTNSGVAVYEAIENGEDFIFKAFNKTAEKIDKIDENEVIGKSVKQVFPGVIEIGLFDVLQRVWKTGTAENHPISHYEDQRIKGWRENYIYKLSSGEIVVIYEDITERKQIENKLKYNQEMYETIFNSAPIGIIIENENGDILKVNKAECEMTGYTKEELQGSNVLDKFVIPEYQESAKANIKKIMQGKKIEFDANTSIKDGQIKYHHLKETNITFPDGNKGIISMRNDITKRKKAEEKLKESEQRLDSLISNTPAVIHSYHVYDGEMEITYINDNVENILGFAPDNFIGNDEFHQSCIHPDDRESVFKEIQKLIQGETDSITMTYRFKDNSDNYHWLRDTHRVISREDEEIEIVGAWWDITKRKQAEEKIQFLSFHDKLTGLYNRRFFEEEIERLDTERQLPISVIAADINGLKIINDSLGHKKGDQLLKKSAEILKAATRKEDILARQGGDEFAILLPKTGKEKAKKVIERIKEKSRETNDDELTVTIALGAAVKNNQDQNIEDILRKADNVMYQNKLSESRNAKSRIINSLLRNLEIKSYETREHIERMKKLAVDFGERLELSTSEISRLTLLARLHDIGKTTIDEKILKKPGSLSDKEWRIIKDHPERGYKIASSSQEFAVVADDIYAHHERWDGSGYPKGLSGDNIPYLARIISIIDAYDVMTNDRPYSKAISKEEALAEIRDCAGSQFDQDLAVSFIELMNNE